MLTEFYIAETLQKYHWTRVRSSKMHRIWGSDMHQTIFLKSRVMFKQLYLMDLIKQSWQAK